ncbi:hypothetical protein DAI22_03g239501 [Oryza sativa Japonica Group]|nr:hypothetical protein DAI22_03g239501 [Oryza sativa Japonica Group]
MSLSTTQSHTQSIPSPPSLVSPQPSLPSSRSFPTPSLRILPFPLRSPPLPSPSPSLAASPLPSLLPCCLPLPFLFFPFPSSLPAAVVGGGDPAATKPLVRRGY